MKYMHFNSSCSYCAISFILTSFNIEVDDIDIALKIGLPYIFAYENNGFLAGPMLQSGKYFNSFLNPLGLNLEERHVKKELLLSFLENKHCIMLGLKTDFGKHAVVLVNHENDTYNFFNPTWQDSNQKTEINISKEELLDRVDNEIVIGEIKICQKAETNLKAIYQESIINLEKYRESVIAFINSGANREEFRKQLDILFRPLLLDGLSMMTLIGNMKMITLIKEAQTQLLDFIRGDKNLNVTLFKERICLVISNYQDLINDYLM